jgi:hypothetical protein
MAIFFISKKSQNQLSNVAIFNKNSNNSDLLGSQDLNLEINCECTLLDYFVSRLTIVISVKSVKDIRKQKTITYIGINDV